MRTKLPLPATVDPAIGELALSRPLANTHDHQFPEKQRLALGPRLDWTLCMDGYAVGVLSRAGMPQDKSSLICTGLSPEEKWDLVAPYWRHARLTGVMQPQILAARLLYGVADINRETVGDITRQIQAANRPGICRHILQDVAGFHHVQNCSTVQPIYPVDFDARDGFQLYDMDLSRILTGKALPDLAARSGREIKSFADYLAAVDWCFTQYGKRAVALKVVNNYWRALDFVPATPEEAASAFAKNVLGGEPTPARVFEDFMLYRSLGSAREYDLPIRFHCGFTAGISPLPDVRPSHIERLVASARGNRFVLLHAGYPFAEETVALCQAYPHVYADLGWIWQIDPVWSERFVREFVTACGPRQLLLFGGDTGFPETSFAYSLGARLGLARVLTGLQRDRLADAADIDFLFDRLLVENSRECFSLEAKFGM